MARFFNTAGPCDPEIHYMLPPLQRLPAVRDLIDQRKYFILHAARQVGKTTALGALAQALTAEGRYAAVLVSMETGAAFPADIGGAEDALLHDWRRDIRFQLPAELHPPPFPAAPAGSRLAAALESWAAASPRPLVVFLDEIDALRGETLVSMLRQVRSGYRVRPTLFPWSLALCGMRDVRDYKFVAGEEERSHGASPFNIKAASITMSGFSATDIAALYAQHSTETGQAFLPEATARAFALTQGQPWLVNALAREVTEVLVRDRGTPLTAAHIDAAKEALILRQDTHLDSLAERLREPRVRRVIEPILSGQALDDLPGDDQRLVIDLGLCRLTPEGRLEIANPIYKEVIPRVLASGIQASIPSIKPTWLTAAGTLDAGRLLEAFLAFWRQHGQPLLRAAPYHEIAPHLVLMAFLHRVANGNGSLEREYAIGSGRMDLCLRYGAERLAIEIKVWRGRRPDPLADGLAQLDEYLAGLSLDAGWLVIFDRRRGRGPLAERTRTESARTPSGRSVTVIRA